MTLPRQPFSLLLSALLFPLATTGAPSPAPNLGFEDGTEGWSPVDGVHWKITGDTHAGTGALQLIAYKGAGKDGPLTREVWHALPLPVRPGETYELAAFVKGLGAFGAWRQSAVVRLHAADGRALAEIETPPRSALHFYDETRVLVPVPAAAAHATIGARVHIDRELESITYLRFDDFSLLPAAEADALRRQRREQLAASYHAGPAPAPVRYDSPDSGPVTQGELSLGKFYRFSRQPDAAHPDIHPNPWTAGLLLTDEDTAAEGQPFDPALHVGWRGSELVGIIIDLGRPQALEHAALHGFADHALGAARPRSVEISTRLAPDADWQPFARLNPAPAPASSGPYALETRAAVRLARFVLLTLQPASAATGEPLLLLNGIRLNGKIKNTWKSVPSDGAFHGAFPTAVGHSAEERAGRSGMVIDLFERLVGKKLSMILWYQGMQPGRSFSEIQSLRRNATKDFYGHRHLVLGWEPRTGLEPIIRGELDEHLIQYFRDSIDPDITEGIDSPVWFRPMNEFNGGWVPYALKPKLYRQAWRRLYNIAEQVGATDKHIFVWSPNHRSYPDEPWNNMRNYWPGDQYVDWVGLSAYPPSAKIPVEPDRRYPVVNIREAYDYYVSYKPFMITEGGFDDDIDRVRWVREWFDGLKTERPKLRALIWENHGQRTISRDPEALALYRQLVQDPHWLSETWDGSPPSPAAPAPAAP